MAFIQGSLTDPNPGPALYALMAPALTTAGFTLVDTVTISTRTHKVWKSAAANNVQGLDWYLDIGYQTTGAGTVTLQPFEFFDPATDLGYRGGFTGSGTVMDAATSSRYGATGYALETNWIGAPTLTNYPTTLPVSTFGYWVSVTGDRIILLLSTDPTAVTYVGFYQSDALYAAKAGAAIYPLIGVKLPGSAAASSGSGTSGRAALTRIAPATAMGLAGWAAHIYADILDADESSSYPTLPAAATNGYPFVALPIELFATASGITSVSMFTRYGTLRDMAQIPTTATVVRGDTVTIAGAQWVLAGNATTQSLLFKAA